MRSENKSVVVTGASSGMVTGIYLTGPICAMRHAVEVVLEHETAGAINVAPLVFGGAVSSPATTRPSSTGPASSSTAA